MADFVPKSALWVVYVLKCADATYYTGVTTDLSRRLREHNGMGTGRRGAKYTATRRPVTVVYYERAANRSQAQQREAALRQLSHHEKAALIQCVEV